MRLRKKEWLAIGGVGCSLMGVLMGFSRGASSSTSGEVPSSQSLPQQSLKEEWIWVSKPDGAQSCEPVSGLSLKDGEQKIKDANIPVRKSRKGSDGQMHAQMCGADKGTTNAYEIPKSRLADAQALGYRPE